MKKTILTALAATTCMMTMNGQPKLSATNIDEVLQAMTLEEKARLLVGGANNFFGDQAVVGGEAPLVAGAAGTSPEIARLGGPVHGEGLQRPRPESEAEPLETIIRRAAASPDLAAALTLVCS